jgi:hypothetical protein
MESTVPKAVAAKKPSASSTLSLKITLLRTKPPIWRRILVPASMTLAELHEAIQAVMGWYDSHLHAFDLGGTQYGDPDTMEDVENERRVTLVSIIKMGATKFRYTYDFGDDWEHEIVIEKPPPANPAQPLPVCIAGKRNAPPEDCGGPWGYEEMLAILADPAHPEHGDKQDWLGAPFDPEAFSVADADAELAEAFGRKPA